MGNNSYSPQICIGCQKWKIEQISSEKYLYQNEKSKQKVFQFQPSWQQLFTSEQEKLMYHWRLQNKGRHNLVQVFQFNTPQLVHSCCSKTPPYYSIFTQYIIPVSKVRSLPYSSMLSIISDWINGFRVLSQHFGFSMLEEGMLGWNSRQIGKVWVNSNFAINHPYQKVRYDSFDYQRYVVKTIIQIVLRNRQKNYYEEKQLTQLVKYNFAAAKQKINKLIHSCKRVRMTKLEQIQPKKKQRRTLSPSPRSVSQQVSKPHYLQFKIQDLKTPKNLGQNSLQKSHSEEFIFNDVRKSKKRNEAHTADLFSHHFLQIVPNESNSITKNISENTFLNTLEISDINRQYKLEIEVVQSESIATLNEKEESTHTKIQSSKFEY